MMPTNELRQLTAIITNALELFKRHKVESLSAAETRSRLSLAAAARHIAEEMGNRPK
jgi:hypothetical protein